MKNYRNKKSVSGMVDVGKKRITEREAVAEGNVLLKPSVVAMVKKKKIPKGDVFEAARLAGILAAKKTPALLPLCHPIPIDYVRIQFSLARKKIQISAAVSGRAKTGVEMEALTAVSIAALTIYDMCKPLGKEIAISDIRLMRKTGGKSGTYERK